MSDEQTTQTLLNEHIIWGYGSTRIGDNVLLLGISHKGLDYLRDGQKTLTISPPSSLAFSQVVIYSAPTKEDMKKVLRASGLPIEEHKLDKL